MSRKQLFILLDVLISKQNTIARLKTKVSPKGFIDKKVIFMAKFTRVGVACNIIAPEGFNAHSFTFAKTSFTPEYIGFYPPRGDSFLIEFFGLTKVGVSLVPLYRFLIEEKYRN